MYCTTLLGSLFALWVGLDCLTALLFETGQLILVPLVLDILLPVVGTLCSDPSVGKQAHSGHKKLPEEADFGNDSCTRGHIVVAEGSFVPLLAQVVAVAGVGKTHLFAYCYFGLC